MSRLFRSFTLVSVVFSLFLTRTNSTLAATVPLYLELGDGSVGDLFSYTAAGLQRLTTYGYNTTPVLSPDGNYIVYGSYAQSYVTDNAAGNGRSGSPAMNIWLMETKTGNFKRIADQPANANIVGSGVRPFIARSGAVWSPDSKNLAWLEDAQGSKDGEDDQNDHLMLYNLASDRYTEIYKQPIFAEGCPCSKLHWTDSGIDVVSASDPTGPTQWRILNTSGTIVTQIQFDPYPFVTWLTGEKSPTIVTSNELITINDQVHSKTLPPLEIYSLSAADGIHFRSNSGFYDAQWSLVAPGTAPFVIGKITDYAISPDGKMAAYIAADDNALYIFDGSKIAKADLSSIKVRNVDPIRAAGLVWSPLTIRIQASAVG